MEFLKYLKSSAKSNTSVRTKFLQQYSRGDKSLHVFYEGNDDPSFYSNYLHRSKSKIYYYQAENKKGVYEIHSKINWNAFKRDRALFFVDKDFSDILKEPYPIENNIFVTKYYSKENYLVCKSVFQRILREILHIDDEKFINGCFRDFNKTLKDFTIKILPIIAWIIYHRKIKSNLQLTNFKISDIFYFDNNLKIHRNRKCKGLNVKNFLLSKTKLIESNNSWKEILQHLRDIDKIKQHKIFLRGKYEMWFMITYVNKLVSVINASKAKGERKIKMQFSLTPDNAVELLGPRLKAPADISSFVSAKKL